MLLLSSCNSDEPKPDVLPGEGEIGAACADHAECHSAFCILEPSFQEGYCSSECSTDPTCPEGALCQGYGGYKFCFDLCGADEECRAGYVCDYGVCRPPCARDTFCQSPEVCLQGRCKAGCVGDEECQETWRCQDGKCLPPCKSEAECLPGFTCNVQTGKCLAKPGKKMGEPCAASGECATAYCLPTRQICSVTCKGTAACPSKYACGLEKVDKERNGSFEAAEADCVPVQGAGVAGAPCGKDADCVAGHCYYGFCMDGCAADPDCGALQCVQVNILLDGGVPKYKGCLPRQGIGSFTLGTFSAAEGSVARGLDIPPNASSFVITTESPQTSTEVPAVFRLLDPAGVVLSQLEGACERWSQPIRYFYEEQLSSLFVPNTPAVKLEPGLYTYHVAATDPALPVTVKLLLKLGKAQKGILNLNWFFLNLAGDGICIPGAALNAAAAPSHSWFGKLRNNLTAVLGTAGLAVGKETFQDLKNPALDIIEENTTGLSTELQQLFASSKGMQGDVLNIFMVRKIEVKGVLGSTILGIAGGIPGPIGVHGSVHSGVALSMETACFEPMGYNPAIALAHEIGHYLGLFHNLEKDTHPGFDGKQVVCPCPCGANMTCTSDPGLPSTSWCRGMDPIPDTDTKDDNLMFFSAENTEIFKGGKLTPGQIRVLLDNPLVGY